MSPGVGAVETSAATAGRVGRAPTDGLWLPLTQHSALEANPATHIVAGDGCYLTDATGQRLFDGISGLWCVNVGYGRPELAEVAAQQMRRLPYLSPTMRHDPGSTLSSRILELLELDGYVYFTTSGSEANEAAFKIARQFHLQSGDPQRYKIVSRYRSYHGNTLGAMAATGQAERKSGYEPMPTGFIKVPPPYPYRRHPRLDEEEHGGQAVDWLEEVIVQEGEETVAAVIVEPIISGGGVIVPPSGYLAGLRRVCDAHGVLVIWDEVVGGFGRTGRMFGHQHWTTSADIVCMAKGIASGYLPIGAVAVSDRVFEAFLGEPGDLRHFRHINTFGAHPVSAAVALKNLEILADEGLVSNAERMGQRLLDGLRESADHEHVGEVRGRGLLVGIELVADKETKEPLDSQRAQAVVQACRSRGLIVGRNGNTVPGRSNILIVAPPLIVSGQEIDMIVSTVQDALSTL